MNPRYPAVARRANHRCEYCRAPEKVINFEFEVEHIFPTSLGGSNDLSNLALACPACNRYKSDSSTGTDEQVGNEVDLFNPRTDRWDEHFRLDPDTGLLHGLTPTGRATVNQLRFNEPQHLTARLIWIDLHHFP